MDLTERLSALRAARRQPSLSGALARDGELVWADAVGDADPLGGPRDATTETQYRVASITKPQVAVALMRLVDAGAVDLHRPVSTWVPDAPGGDATVAQFLSHTSGLPAEPAGPWWERAGGHGWDDLVAMDLRRLSPPGSRFHYSNVGFAVLGRLLEVLTGQPWDAALADLVWTPLGMTRTGRAPASGHAVGVAVHPTDDLVHPEPVPDYLAMGPAGELWSTPTDLVRLGALVAGDVPGVLRPDTLALMRRIFTVNDVEGRPWGSGYGLGLRIMNADGRRSVGHTGSVPGFTADLETDATSGLVIAVCGNATSGFGGALDLLRAAADALGERTVPPVDDPAAAELVGPWYWGALPHTMSVLPDGRLHLAGTPGSSPSVFVRRGADWVGTGGDYFHGETLRVVRDAHGVRALDLGTFCFTRTPYDPDADLPGGGDPTGWRAPAAPLAG